MNIEYVKIEKTKGVANRFRFAGLCYNVRIAGPEGMDVTSDFFT